MIKYWDYLRKYKKLKDDIKKTIKSFVRNLLT